MTTNRVKPRWQSSPNFLQSEGERKTTMAQTRVPPSTKEILAKQAADAKQRREAARPPAPSTAVVPAKARSGGAARHPQRHRTLHRRRCALDDCRPIDQV